LLLFLLFLFLLFLLLLFQLGQALLGGLGLLEELLVHGFDFGEAALEALGFGLEAAMHLLKLLILEIEVLPI
jgi:hypothetical protein